MARLGPTDVFGPLRIDNQIISTETTGTPAFVIGSTTVIPNLNADLLDGYHASTSPTANTVMLRDGNGYSYSVHHNLSRGDETSAAASYVYDTGDGWLRKKTVANVKTELGIPSSFAPTNADNTAANQTSHSDVVVDGDVASVNTASKIVQRNASKDIFVNSVNLQYTVNNPTVGHIITKNTTDNYARSTSMASFKTAMGSGNGSLVPAAGTAGQVLLHSGVFGGVPKSTSTIVGGAKMTYSAGILTIDVT